MSEDHKLVPALPVLDESASRAILECVQRCRRMETRLTLLCMHQGLDPTNKSRIQVVSTEPPFVELSGYDVSIGDILTGVKAAGIVKGIVTILHKGALVGNIDVNPKQLTMQNK